MVPSSGCHGSLTWLPWFSHMVAMVITSIHACLRREREPMTRRYELVLNDAFLPLTSVIKSHLLFPIGVCFLYLHTQSYPLLLLSLFLFYSVVIILRFFSSPFWILHWSLFYLSCASSLSSAKFPIHVYDFYSSTRYSFSFTITKKMFSRETEYSSFFF